MRVSKLFNIFHLAACLLGLPVLLSAQSEYHHLTFNVGAGFTAVTGPISNRLDHGGNIEGGLGLNLNSYLGVLGTFSYQGLGITRSALNTVNEPDGSARVFTLTIDPKISIPTHGHGSFYVLGGGGWLRRTVEFTQPTLATTIVFDPWWGYFGPALVPVNQVLGSVTDNAGVWDIGGGMNFALPNTSWKLYLQARYYNGMTTGRHTTLVPITLGFRW
jgi:Outer membrane protein beta-barrel domain